ncbi:KDO2-lipid IV(A) lauroyltransferase [Breoghania corrubedonensis]|uniref:KDO2-lipid IV(A) lauroyltransferase n=1 Tax=Breoghania corrubedonensis TaxID=665038 RepID=A0A2T5V8Q5_9HYPH|nr:lipid A biosynthesis acyltransferase [Breoghania corrubedonensis]PTW60114.1 KDO2-lipid IV(A) lauroyltransferase [Breoghania corrubedonensis]
MKDDMARHNLSPLMKLRYAGEYVVLRLVAGLIRLMPVDMASRAMGKAWRLIAPKTKRHAHALEHIALAYPDMPPAERERLARAMWENLGRIAAETFQLDRLHAQPSRYTFDVEDARAFVEKNGGAAVVVSLHTGNWEIIAEPARYVGLDTAGVYQALKNPYADAYLTDMRQRYFPGGLHAKSHSTARRLIQHVRSGGAIAFLADLRDVRGVTVPFFGHPATANPFPVMVARTYGVPLIICRTIRRDGAHFHFEARVLELPREGDRQADIQEGTARIHAVFESWIREHPEQWMWIHRKWVMPKKKRKPASQ